MKIFNTEVIADLVRQYQAGNKEVIESILEECTPLVNYMVRNCNPADDDDMRQEVFIKIIKSLEHFNPDKANVHTYFSRVIRNTCITHFHKDMRGAGDCDLDDESQGLESIGISFKLDDTMSDLLQRNRQRFPSMPAAKIDAITEMAYLSIYDGLDKGRTVVRQISKTYDMPRENALAIYSSTIIYLRQKFSESCDNVVEIDEFSLLPELKELLGEDNFSKLITSFSGIIIHM
jgi:RNA polymerase sigma factor (sigma-70 family)